MGAVLAGGAGRRLGGAKAMQTLAGRPLIIYPLTALAEVVADIAIIAKPDTALPAVDEAVRVVREPATPRHPLVGIVAALRAAQGRSVLVCAADMPFLTGAALCALRDAPAGEGAAVLAAQDGGPQPLLGRYEPAALSLLDAAAREATRPAREVVAALSPVLLELPGTPEVLFNVNRAEDLAEAERRMISRR